MSDKILKRTISSLWPIFLTYLFISIMFSAVFINMINFSVELIWVGESFNDHVLEMGLILSIRNVMWGISGLIFGSLADRFSRKKLFMVSSFFIGLSCIIFSQSPEHLGPDLFYFFLFANALSGIGFGGIYPIISSLTNDYLEKAKIGKFFGFYSGINLIFANVGMIVAAFAFRLGRWKTFFGITGILIWICLLFIWFQIQEPPRAHLSSKKLASVLKSTKSKYQYRMNRHTFRKTVLSKSNSIIILEGIFTFIFFEIIVFLIVPYLEQAPLNLDESSIAVIFVAFAVPGVIISQFLTHFSDSWSKKDIKNRISILIFAVSLAVASLYITFLLPFSPLTEEQGKDLSFIMLQPQTWLIGLFISLILISRVLYLANQPPVIQAINLPEIQGFIISIKQFLEIVGSAIAPLVGAAILLATGSDYRTTAMFAGLLGFPQIILWILSRKTVKKDITRLEEILEDRAEEIIASSGN